VRMLVLPLPLIASLLLLYLAARAFLSRTATPLILAFLVLIAIQTALIAARFHYGLSWPSWPMPIIALLIPAISYVAFVDLAIRPFTVMSDWIHLSAPVVGLLLRLFYPFLLDVLIPLVFVLYAVLMLRRLSPGSDGLPLVRLEASRMSLGIWRFIAGCLLISALVDVLVAIDMTFDGGERSMAIIGTAQSMQLLAFGLLSLSRTNDVIPEINPSVKTELHPRVISGETSREIIGETTGNSPAESPGVESVDARKVSIEHSSPVQASFESAHFEAIDGDAELTRQVQQKTNVEKAVENLPGDGTQLISEHLEDQRLLERAQSLMTQQHLYQDADLSLSRLARRLGVPAKNLSTAINRLEAQNVSQWVNGYRVADACRQLEQGQVSITVASLNAGFRTKSNFNREFRRIKGVSPSQWLERRDSM